MSTLLRWIKKVFKVFGIFLLAIVIIINLFIILSGRFYLYKGIAKTYLMGKSGPDIYDLDLFPYSTIKKSGETFKWGVDHDYNVYNFTPEEV